MYKLEVTMKSSEVTESGEAVFQVITVEEYSPTPENHLEKNMAVAAGVFGAFGGLVEKAKSALSK